MTDESSFARVDQILLWYDQPEILLCKRTKFEYILAVASGCPDDDDDVYYGVSLHLQALMEYQDEKHDLRYALLHPPYRRYWRFKFDPEVSEVKLNKVKKSDAGLNISIPGSGVFAREHQTIRVISQFQPDTEEVFNIDGGWEVDEISRFYGQMEDVYYILNDLDRWRRLSPSSRVRKAITSSFEKPFQGGGSYRSLYVDVANDNASYTQLKFAGIEYNSPGFLRIGAKKSAMNRTLALLESFSDRIFDAKKSYRDLYKTLQQANLLSAKRGTSVSARTLNAVLVKSTTLANFLPGVSFENLQEMAQGDTVTAAKVLLSIHRRVDALYQYFDQGRVKHEAVHLT